MNHRWELNLLRGFGPFFILGLRIAELYPALICLKSCFRAAYVARILALMCSYPARSGVKKVVLAGYNPFSAVVNRLLTSGNPFYN